MGISYTPKSKKIRADNATEWNKGVKTIVIKLKPNNDSKYIQEYESIEQEKNIDKLKFLLDFYKKNK